MAETTERPDQMSEAERLDYQPVSGWAVAAAAVAGLNVLIILVGGGIALYSWSPYLLPLWTLLVPALGLALALGAQAHIRRSEGTRAGAPLARASAWTCLLLGAIYLSFYVATFMAVRRQADSFVHDWFNLLRSGNANLAFLYTRPPEQRLGVSPDDEAQLRVRFDVGAKGGSGPLNTFRSSELTQLIQQGGDEAKIEGRGVQAWEFTEGSYRVVRTYHVTTPEGEIDVTLTTIGAESKTRTYEGRQWHLFENTISKGQLSAFGNQVNTLRLHGFVFLQAWRQKLASGTPEGLESAYLDTRPPSEREKASADFKAGKIDVRGIMETKNLRADDAAARQEAIEGLETIFQVRKEDEIRVVSMDVKPLGNRRWEKTKDGRIIFAYDGKFLLAKEMKPRFQCELSIILESDPGAVDKGESAHWRILRIEALTAQDPLRLRGTPGGE